MVSRYKGQVTHWDVVNELLHGTLFSSMLPCGGTGPCICDYAPACANTSAGTPPNATAADALAAWMFRAVHATDPQAVLFLNDYGVIETDVDPLSGAGTKRASLEVSMDSVQ